MSNRTHPRWIAALGLMAMPVVGVACGSAKLDAVAIMSEPVEWPVCLQSWMEARMRQCPSPPVAGPDPPPASCREAPRPKWDQTKRPLHPDADLRAAALAAQPNLRRAEALYDEAAEDTDARGRARRAYEPLARAKDDAPGTRHARYMLGFIHAHDNRIDDALTAWASVQHQQTDELATSARRAYLELFARERPAALAVPALRPLDLRLFDALDHLAQRYAARGRWDAAAAVMGELRRRDPERACTHQLRAVDAIRRTGDRNATAGALNQLLEELAKPVGRGCRQEGARQILALGDEWRALGLGTKEQAGHRKLLGMAAEAYEVALSRFDTDELQGEGVCRHATALWYERASLLEQAGNWPGCAAAYDDALTVDATTTWGERGALGAMTCHLAAYSAQHDALPTLPTVQRAGKQLDDASRWRSTLRAFHRFLCVADPTEDDARTTAGLERGEVFLEGGALWESVLAFRIAAFDAPPASAGPQGDGPRAGARYATVMDQMAVDDSCRIELNRDLMQLLSRHCPSPDASVACATMQEVHDRLEAELGPRLP